MKDYFEIAKEYQKKYKLKINGKFGQDDETDAFRHAFASADVALKYSVPVSAAGGYANEIFDFLVQEQTPSRQNMDLYNNSAGRDIAKEIKKEIGTNAVKNLPEKERHDLIAQKIYTKMKQGKLIVEASENQPSHYTRSWDNFYDEKNPYASKADYVKDLLLNPPAKKEGGTKLTGQTLKDMLDSQYKKLNDFREQAYIESSLEKRFKGDIPKGYKNKETGNEKIFTKEQIDSMSGGEKEKFKKAINYQKKTIGIPSEKEAKETVSKGGMVYVESYQRADGTKVRGYYRSK